MAVSLLNVPYFLPVSWNCRSFFHFFSFRVMLDVFIQEHLLCLFEASFPLSSNNVQAPLCLHLFFNWFIKPVTAVFNEDAKMMFVYFKKVLPSLQQNSVSLESVRSLNSHCFQIALEKNPKFTITFLAIIISKKGSVQCCV